MNFFKKIFKNEKQKEDYSNFLNLEKFEKEIDIEINDFNKKYIKIITLYNKEQIPYLKQEIYNENILLVDISFIEDNELLKDQFFKELKEVTLEIKGDIVGIKDHLVIITPNGIEVDRKKIGDIYNEQQ